MTDIEFLVSELRKAHETIDKLNKENLSLRDTVATLRNKMVASNPLSDFDALARLRKKIEEDVKRPKYIRTIRNKGYILNN